MTDLDDLLSILVCPADQQKLAPQGDGSLECVSCGRRYPVEQGIASFVDLTEDPAAEIKAREISSRDASYSDRRRNRRREVERLPEIAALKRMLGNVAGKTLIDAGCGYGETTAVAKGAACLVGVDFSVEGLRRYVAPAGVRVLPVHADVIQPPFPTGFFDAAISSQVLEHLPRPEQRDAYVRGLARVLKPGGRLALTVYNWHQARKRQGIAKEGFHASGVFYHCYEPAELKELVAPHFGTVEVFPVGAILPGLWRLKRRLGRFYPPVDRLLCAVPQTLRYGELLAAQCLRP